MALKECPTAKGVYVDKLIADLVDVRVTLNLTRLQPRDRTKLLKACDFGYLSAGVDSTATAVYRTLCSQFGLPLVVIGAGNAFAAISKENEAAVLDNMLMLTGISNAGTGWLKNVLRSYDQQRQLPDKKVNDYYRKYGTREYLLQRMRSRDIKRLARPSGMKPEAFLNALGRQYFPAPAPLAAREAARKLLLMEKHDG